VEEERLIDEFGMKRIKPEKAGVKLKSRRKEVSRLALEMDKDNQSYIYHRQDYRGEKCSQRLH